jgi:hypothetical protein
MSIMTIVIAAANSFGAHACIQRDILVKAGRAIEMRSFDYPYKPKCAAIASGDSMPDRGVPRPNGQCRHEGVRN